MGTAKRERQKAGRQARLEQAKAAEARKKRTRFVVYGAILVGVIIVALFALAPDDDDVTASGTTSSTSSTASTTPGETVATVAITVPPPGETLTGATPCPAADGSSPRTTTFAEAPPTCIDAAKTYTAEVLTTEGIFTLELDPAAAPQTVNNFVVLARYHFYDGLAFHRIITGFMNQTGDAVGPTPGQGGPGYTIPDELPDGRRAVPGGLAGDGEHRPARLGWQPMVRHRRERRRSARAQLQPVRHRHLRHRGGAPDQPVQRPGQRQRGTPTQEVVIESITITES